MQRTKAADGDRNAWGTDQSNPASPPHGVLTPLTPTGRPRTGTSRRTGKVALRIRRMLPLTLGAPQLPDPAWRLRSGVPQT
jgi:hypothetical protein